MSITIYNYIDPSSYQQAQTGEAMVTSTTEDLNASSENLSGNTSTNASFDQTLNAAKKAIAAVAIDQLVTASNSGQIDSHQIQQFFDQHGINIKLANLNTSSSDSNQAVTSQSYSTTSENYSNSGDLSCPDYLERIFEEAANTYGVDIKLLKSIGKQESNYDPNATSSSGAMGVMQLMPAAASDLDVDDAYDPYQNIMGGAKLISSLLDKYNGDISLALAAYNAGSGNVTKYGGIPPFEETQNYVRKVLGYYNS